MTELILRVAVHFRLSEDLGQRGTGELHLVTAGGVGARLDSVEQRGRISLAQILVTVLRANDLGDIVGVKDRSPAALRARPCLPGRPYGRRWHAR